MESQYVIPPDSPLDLDESYPCKGCGEILEEGKAFELAGNRWHIHCFKCGLCEALLDSDANLLLLGDGSLICSNCTYSCVGCGNKIEDLAILTGDQAFCANCFKCRNCKKRIDNLKYARTGQGIFCMDCHEALMARRRKRPKGSSRNKNGALLDKSLPAIPPPDARKTAFMPGLENNGNQELSPQSVSSVPSPQPLLDVPSISRTMTELRTETDSDSSRPPTSSQNFPQIQSQGPSLTLPSTTYKNNRHSYMSGQSDASNAGNDEFLIPLAFDPNPVKETPPQSSHSTPRALEERPQDYFNRTTAQPAAPKPSSRGVSPHVNLQDKYRQGQREMVETNRSRREDISSQTGSAAVSPFTQPPEPRREQMQDPNLVSQFANTERPRGDRIKLQEPPKRSGSNNHIETVSGGSTPKPDYPLEPAKVLASHEGEILPQHVYSIPESPLETGAAANNGTVSPSQSTQPSSMVFTGIPKRGDSLESVKRTIPRKEINAAAIIPPAFSELSKDVTSSPSTTDPTKTIGGKNISAPITSAESQSIFDAPLAPQLQPESEKAGESFVDPRVPPPPPVPEYARSRAGSVATMQSDPKYGESQKSPKLPRWSGGGDFTLEEDMARILGSEEPSSSFLRRVSNSVRHGRSYSAQSGRASRDRFPKSPIVAGSTSGQDISSPSSTSPEHRDELVWFKNQLRIEKERNLARERKIAELEAQLDQSASIKQVNSELKEKRSTMVVLDTQKEIVVRELEVLTDHIARTKANQEPFDLAKMNNTILREFAESLEKLKNSFAPQIEEYVEKRNVLLDEIASLTTMKEKSFSEFEQLSSKNAQLAELNNQLVHQIQDIYKSNTGLGNDPSRSPAPNGLGIYGHHKDKSQVSIDSRDTRTLVAEPSVTDSTIMFQQNDGEPVQLIGGPNVVSIKKVAQPKKFDWRKGQKVAKGMAKGVKGAFSSTQQSYNRDLQFAETGAYGQMVPSQEFNGVPRHMQDPSRQGFGFFGNQKPPMKGNGLYNVSHSNASTPSIGLDPSIYLFGSDLEQRADYERSAIPMIVRRCVEEVEARGMDVEGIYRKSGGNSQVIQVKEIFEKPSPDRDISDPEMDIHAVTSGLKQYFRKLPMPLITYEVYDVLLEATSVPEGPNQQGQRIEAIQHALRGLPKAHYDTLEYLIGHLSKVVVLEKENLMTSTNIAVVFAPTIMRPESVSRELTDTKAKNEVVMWMVEEYENVFRR